jgi:TrfA protein
MSNDLNAALQRLGQAIDERDKAAGPKQPEPKPPAKIYQLPLWPEVSPGAPNAVLRSALFPAIQSKDRRMLDNELIASIKGQEIRFTGKQLNQEDLEVWLEVLDIAKNHPLGNLCHSSAHGLLKALDRATGNHDHQQLDASLTRLVACGVKVIIGRRFEYTGGLLHDVFKDDATRQYRIQANPRLAAFFAQGWTRLDRPTRRKLRGKPMALWLQAHYATHKDPLPYSVELLRQLSGSRTKDLFKFRQNLREALTALQATGAIASWEIDSDDLVRVYKVPTITQRRSRGRPRK